MPDHNIVLETKSVRIRKVRSSDVLAFFTYLQDPDVTQFLGIEPPKGATDIRRYIGNLEKRWRSGDSRAFTLCLLDSSTREIVTGVVSLEDINYRDLKGELGIWLGKQFWGKNIAKTGITLILQVAFLTLALRRVFARVAGGNVHMQRRFEDMGFRQEGVLRQDIEIHGVPADMILYAILRNEYLDLKSS